MNEVGNHSNQIPSYSSPLNQINKETRISAATNSAGYDKVGNVFTNTLNRLVEFIKNPLDPEWRKNQKYSLVLSQIKEIREENISKRKEEKNINLFGRDVNDTYIEKMTSAHGDPQIAEFARRYETVIKILNTEKGVYPTEREHYKAFIDANQHALAAPYYIQLMNDLPPYHTAMPEAREKVLKQLPQVVKDLHALSYTLFAEVIVTDFMNTMATGISEKGHPAEDKAFVTSNEQVTAEELIQNFKAVVAKDNIDNFAKGIEAAPSKFKSFAPTKWASSIKGHWDKLDFNPIKDGNPPNLAYVRQTAEGKKIHFIRTPSPTIGNKVNPAFCAFLTHLEANGEKYVYFNLQDRRQPDQHPSLKKRVKEKLGSAREDRRVTAFEALAEDPAYKNVFQVVTLDKNSNFYWQRDHVKTDKLLSKALEQGIIKIEEKERFKKRLANHATEGEAIQEIVNRYRESKNGNKITHDLLEFEAILTNKNKFLKEFKQKLFVEKTSFNLSEKYSQTPHRENIEKILEQVTATYFPLSSGHLTPLECQKIIELSYDLIQDYIILESGATYINISCKDCIDRGWAEKAKKQAKEILMEVCLGTKERLGELQQNINQWVPSLFAPSLWARKRQILPERRARVRQAVEAMTDLASKNPEAFMRLNALPQRLIELEKLKTAKDERIEKLKEARGTEDVNNAIKTILEEFEATNKRDEKGKQKIEDESSLKNEQELYVNRCKALAPVIEYYNQRQAELRKDSIIIESKELKDDLQTILTIASRASVSTITIPHHRDQEKQQVKLDSNTYTANLIEDKNIESIRKKGINQSES